MYLGLLIFLLLVDLLFMLCIFQVIRIWFFNSMLLILESRNCTGLHGVCREHHAHFKYSLPMFLHPELDVLCTRLKSNRTKHVGNILNIAVGKTPNARLNEHERETPKTSSVKVTGNIFLSVYSARKKITRWKPCLYE